jgi:small subunit ribosomal protein S6
VGALDQRRIFNMPMYETIFILDSLLAPEEIDKIIDRVKEVVESNGGKIVTVDKWGKRRLAYEIQKKQYGFYVAIEFEGEGPIPNTLANEYNFNEKVLRYLTYRYTKNKLKARSKESEIKVTQADVPEIEQTHQENNTKKLEAVADIKDQESSDEEVENA